MKATLLENQNILVMAMINKYKSIKKCLLALQKFNKFKIYQSKNIKIMALNFQILNTFKIDRWMDRWVDRWIDGKAEHKKFYTVVDGWISGWMDGWVDGLVEKLV